MGSRADFPVSEGQMFVYVAGLGMMERAEFLQLQKAVKRFGGGILEMPPFCEDDLPLERVQAFEPEQEAMAEKFIADAVFAWAKSRGFGPQVEASK